MAQEDIISIRHIKTLPIPSSLEPLRAAILGRYYEELRKFAAILVKFRNQSKDPEFTRVINESLTWVERAEIATIPPPPEPEEEDEEVTPPPVTPPPEIIIPQAEIEAFARAKKLLSSNIAKERDLLEKEEGITKELKEIHSALEYFRQEMLINESDILKFKNLHDKIFFDLYQNIKSLSPILNMSFKDLTDLLEKIKIIMQKIVNLITPKYRALLQSKVSKLDESIKNLEKTIGSILRDERDTEDKIKAFEKVFSEIFHGPQKIDAPKIYSVRLNLGDLISAKENEINLFKSLISSYDREIKKLLDDIEDNIIKSTAKA